MTKSVNKLSGKYGLTQIMLPGKRQEDLKKRRISIQEALRKEQEEKQTFDGDIETQDTVQAFDKKNTEQQKVWELIERIFSIVINQEKLLGKKCYHPLKLHNLKHNNRSIAPLSIGEIHQSIMSTIQSVKNNMISSSLISNTLFSNINKSRGYTPEGKYYLGRSLNSQGYLCASLKNTIPGYANCHIQITNDYEAITEIICNIREQANQFQNL